MRRMKESFLNFIIHATNDVSLQVPDVSSIITSLDDVLSLDMTAEADQVRRASALCTGLF